MTSDLSREDREAMTWAREKMRCEDEFAYLAQHYLRIKSKKVIGFPTLKLNRPQQFIHQMVESQLKREGWIRQVYGKCRQVGSSTYWRARSFHLTAFKDYRNAFLCAHDEETVYELFEMDKTFLRALPEALKPAVEANSKTRLVFETPDGQGRNSKLLVGHAKNIDVGASQMNHVVHLTEVARYQNADDVQSSLFPSISDARGEDYSAVVLESTSRYGGVWFKEFAEAAQRGENGYEFHFIPWYWHDEYTTPPPRGFQPDLEERELQKEYQLSLGQLAWRRQKRAEYHLNPALFLQEYPMNWAESWQLPSGTLRVFSGEILARLESQLRPGSRMTADSSGLKEAFASPIEVWEKPQDGVYYDMGVDVAQGRTEESDWTAITVLRRDSLRQVAGARFRMDPASEEFVHLVYWLAMAYNVAQVNVDITGGWGMALMSGLQRRSYPNLWQWRRRDDAKERVSARIGFLYTRRDKAYLINNAVVLVKRGGLVIHSENLLEEIENYLSIGLDEWGPAPGLNDDEVNSWMLALLGARDESADAPMTAEPPDEKPEPVDAYKVHDVERDLREEDRQPAALKLSPWGVNE